MIGFDNERHVYGDARYPAQLVIQDVLTLHGSQFKDAVLIVASPPCQEFSYMAMPWSKAKEKARAFRDGRDDPKRLTALFDACFRIQREAMEAAGHFIPLVIENVCGAQKWVGRARWHFGSFYLWGDVPALMPIVKRTERHTKIESPHLHLGDPRSALGSAARIRYEERRESIKVGGFTWSDFGKPDYKAIAFNGEGAKRLRGRRTDIGKGARFTSRDCGQEAQGIKQRGSGREWFAGDGKISRMTSSQSSARKAASAHIAKIPIVLARHVAYAWYPR